MRILLSVAVAAGALAPLTKRGTPGRIVAVSRRTTSRGRRSRSAPYDIEEPAAEPTKTWQRSNPSSSQPAAADAVSLRRRRIDRDRGAPRRAVAALADRGADAGSRGGRGRRAAAEMLATRLPRAPPTCRRWPRTRSPRWRHLPGRARVTGRVNVIDSFPRCVGETCRRSQSFQRLLTPTAARRQRLGVRRPAAVGDASA